MDNFKKVVSALVLVCIATITAFAQNNLAVITGKVLDESNEPVIGANIQVKNGSTGFKTGGITNEKGEYIIKQLPLGSPYEVICSYIGYKDQSKKGYSLNQGDVLRVDFKLNENSVELNTVDVVANSLKKGAATAGSATSISSTDMARLPVNGRNFTSLMTLSPLTNGSNLSGQLASSTGYTIDGMYAKNPTSGGTTNRNGGPYAITMEAIREFAVVTNQYDVTNGRAGGGSISTVTKSGTNDLHGSAFLYARADWLSSPYDIKGNKRDNDFSTYQYGFSVGGPIIKDRAHFFFTWDHQAYTAPLNIANIKTTDDEKTYSITQATLDEFLSVAREKYGVSSSQQTGAFSRKQGTDALFGRIDWQINPTNLLTIRDNFCNDNNHQYLSDNTSIGLYEVYGNVHSLDNSLMASLRSVLGPKATNELKLQHLYTVEESSPGDQLPSTNIPRAIVQNVASTLSDGSTAYTSIQLGGQRYCPENFYNNVYHLVDNMYYNTARINYTFGADFMYTHMNSRYGSETNGRFYYSGMENFINNTPYRYVREVYIGDDRVKQNIVNGGLYAQMQTTLMKGLDFTGGLRLDDAAYLNKGNFSQTVYDELGLRTDNGLSTFTIQPRVQFTWDINDKHVDVFRLGAGIFSSDINNYAMINNMVFDGTKVASIDITGSDVPTPDFIGYRNGTTAVPGIDLLSNPNIKNVSTINMNGADCKVPTVYKANFSYTHYFSDRLKVGFNAYMNLARNNYMYVDRNMVDEPYFRIAAEANRGVYVPASTINTSTGVADWTQGRKSTEIGRVLELVSEGKVNQFAMVLDATWRYYKDGQITASYTWNDSRDNTSYNGNVANSATLSQMVVDDPRDLSKMTYSSNQFRHKLVVYATAPTFWGINAGLRFSGVGGTRYTAIVNGNVNGDFVSSNDLAYIYDPYDSNTPDNIKEGMLAILNNDDVADCFKDYLRSNFGKMAERNGGKNGFYGTFDLRLSKKFNFYKSHNLELSVDVFNVANLLNKDWGVKQNLSYVALYTITGFDAENQVYKYSVNKNAGKPTKSGDPYQIQIGLRYAF